MKQTDFDRDTILKRGIRNLRFMLVLSMIGSGYCLLEYFYMGLMLPSLTQMYQDGTMMGPITTISEMLNIDQSVFTASFESMIRVPQLFYLLTAWLYAMSLTGVIMMWKLRKNGFHFYTIAQLLVIIVTILFLGKTYVRLGDIMLTLLFVGYYYISFMGLEKLKEAPDNMFSPTNDNDSDSENSEESPSLEKKSDEEAEKD